LRRLADRCFDFASGGGLQFAIWSRGVGQHPHRPRKDGDVRGAGRNPFSRETRRSRTMGGTARHAGDLDAGGRLFGDLSVCAPAECDGRDALVSNQALWGQRHRGSGFFWENRSRTTRKKAGRGGLEQPRHQQDGVFAFQDLGVAGS
jgi:hypothetical protein